MTDGWKRFWHGFLAALGVIASAVVGLLLLRGRKLPSTGGTPEQIASEAEAQIEKTKQEIKADSDAALADRFNALAKKQETKG
jgi:hypothetical protein